MKLVLLILFRYGIKIFCIWSFKVTAHLCSKGEDLGVKKVSSNVFNLRIRLQSYTVPVNAVSS
jgi:hypothetical protein